MNNRITTYLFPKSTDPNYEKKQAEIRVNQNVDKIVNDYKYCKNNPKQEDIVSCNDFITKKDNIIKKCYTSPEHDMYCKPYMDKFIQDEKGDVSVKPSGLSSMFNYFTTKNEPNTEPNTAGKSKKSKKSKKIHKKKTHKTKIHKKKTQKIKR
jgi:hypothetical protein